MHARVPTQTTSSKYSSRQSDHHATGIIAASGDLSTRAAPATFTTQAPDLLAEKAQGTKLFVAFDELQVRVAAWTARLARELVSVSVEDCALAVAPPVSVSSNERQFADRRRLSPSRRHTQIVGESVAAPLPLGTRASDVNTQSAPPSARDPDIAFRKKYATRDGAHAALAASNDPTTTPSPTTALTATSVVNANKNAPTLSPTTPTLATTIATPSWLVTEMEAFFRDTLAHAIQARETAIVNVMHDCVQQELADKERRVEQERRRALELETQSLEFGKTKDHFQSKLDRRVAENNALRKDFYKQLLMLRELVAKNRNDPHTLRALEEVMAAVALSGTGTPTGGVGSFSTKSTMGKASLAWADPNQNKNTTRSDDQAATTTPTTTTTTTTAAASMRREKEKWEQRAREAVAECQNLQVQILQLKQQLEEARGLDGELWFATAEHGLFERQRIIDCVYKSKCSWDQVGDAVVELLNHEMVWEAVEDSAYREKTRVSRGLEALLLRVEAMVGGNNPQGPSTSQDDGNESNAQTQDGDTCSSHPRHRSAFSHSSRLIACRTCNGCGYLDTSSALTGTGNPAEQNDDSYLRKTLAQVLELKASLEEANNRTDQVEQQLLRTVMEGAQIKETLEKIQFTRAHGVDSCLQVDLDGEEEIDVDAILQAYSDDDIASETTGSGVGMKRRGGRFKQYEHLIVELKSLLSERDAGLLQLRTTVAETQARLVTVQRTSQQEHEQQLEELQAVKAALALALANRNDAIDDKQAAVSDLLKTMERKTSQVLPKKSFLLPRGSTTHDSGDDGDCNNGESSADDDDESDVEDDFDDHDDNEIVRSERMARRYTQAISRVQLEHDEQQQRLKQAEDELGQESDKRKRTNSISLGNIVVTMASHPRDLFKALSAAQQELLTLRRSSYRSSALQTDRLLTLTRHLAHISEELAMVKKRTCAEIEFWKLDCEKLQHANQALTTDLSDVRQLLVDANERVAQANAVANAVKVCALCEKHEARLLEISSHLLAVSSADGRRASTNATTSVASSSSSLDEAERHGIGAILLDLETLYSTLSVTKQQQAKAAITQALVGTNAFASHVHSSSCAAAAAAAAAAGFLQQATEPGDRTRRSTGYAAASPGTGNGAVDWIVGEVGSRVLDQPSRLFQNPFIGFTADAVASPEGHFLLQGSSIDVTVNTTAASSIGRKTIVRKVLTEQEISKRQRARAYRISGDDPNNAELLQDDDLSTSNQPDSVPATSLEDLLEHDEIAVSAFLDECGNQVVYVDVEVDGQVDEDCALRQRDQRSNQSLEAHARDRRDTEASASTRRSDYTIQIPSPENSTRAHQLVAASSEIDKDPEVIEKLRELVKHSTSAREMLALTNWKILICHLQASRDQKRLDYVNETWRTALASGKAKTCLASGTPTLPHAVRTTMQKLVQFRELSLDGAVRQRDELRRVTRRTQAQLIHSVSNVLSILSRKNKAMLMAPVSDTQPRIHFDPEKTSPSRHYHSPSHAALRPLYPSVRVNLSELPETQQVATPSFPFALADGDGTESLRATLDHRALLVEEKKSPSPRRPRSGKLPSDMELRPSSLFENDNRFPQRVVKFVPLMGDGEELTLTHSTSSLRLATPPYSPAKSPSKAGLVVDVRRRPTHSAEATRPSLQDTAATESPRIAAANYLSSSVSLGTDLRRPTRPQSSPAGMSSRFRAPSVPSVSSGRDGATEARLPERP